MHFVYSQDGTKIAYDKSGQGPALILIAGAFSYRHFPGQVELAKRLSPHFTVYNYDRRGRGDSGNPQQPYAIDREIEDLAALMEAAGGSAYVYGLSSGAALALHAAAKGLNITALALHEPPFVVDSEGHQPPADFLQQVTKLMAEDRRAETIKYFMTKGMGAPGFVVTMMRLMPGVWERLMAVAHTLPYNSALLEGLNAGKPLPAQAWRGVHMPTVVLEGPESPIALRRGTQAAAKVLPNARLVTKKGLGHTKKLGAEAIAQELIAFFARERVGV
ncbi:alpha/beta fold hydrolase [Paenibacillus whitsoniae]|uniref:Alpha/beta hydrolase n=1 Tax=Paenibacillus whitsoniae TaxID=2496558 RepID=A0A3S0BYV0_9BACL|nr:alpha/beta hydrolase [Paenibacillus whitsoniae]RTE11368.1 alpha/beta hydrolase [Paenibacillus whitsoniae]